MPQDALSDILTLFDARPVYAGGITTGGDWAVRFQPPKEIKFFAMGRGTCLIAVDGHEPLRLHAGDVFLLRDRLGFTLASDLSLPALDAAALFASRDRSMVRFGDGDDVVVLGSHIGLGSAASRTLVEALPATIHITAAESAADRLQWLVEEFVTESCSDAPGSELACTTLANLVFLHLLRRYIGGAGNLDAGWLRAIFDPRVGPAVRAMHDDPARLWQLRELASLSGMSRTSFATHFRAVSGMPPLAYLTRWRMHLAECKLREGRALVGEIARSVGYESEAAFSTAFKRVVGHSPRRKAA